MASIEESYEQARSLAETMIFDLSEPGSPLSLSLKTVQELVVTWSKPTEERRLVREVLGDSHTEASLRKLVSAWLCMLCCGDARVVGSFLAGDLGGICTQSGSESLPAIDYRLRLVQDANGVWTWEE